MDSTLIILVLLVLMYVVLFLPRQRQVARQRAMQAALAVGDEVVTIGGLHGTVTALDDEGLQLEVSPGVTLRFVRDAVARRLASEAPPDPQDHDGPEVGGAASDVRGDEGGDDSPSLDEGSASS